MSRLSQTAFDAKARELLANLDGAIAWREHCEAPDNDQDSPEAYHEIVRVGSLDVVTFLGLGEPRMDVYLRHGSHQALNQHDMLDALELIARVEEMRARRKVERVEVVGATLGQGHEDELSSITRDEIDERIGGAR